MGYNAIIGDHQFRAHDFRVTLATKTGSARRPTVDSTEAEVELWVKSNSDDLPDSVRRGLFKLAVWPDRQSFCVMKVEVPSRSGLEVDGVMCTYLMERAWVTEYQELQRPGSPDLVLVLRVRGVMADDPKGEVRVEGA